ncbi:MAG: M67 family metallopeptidase [Deltaproteobacteria bacterium]|nr:M67 family metallopeptidase [Deltaproteobacteria bacterium]
MIKIELDARQSIVMDAQKAWPEEGCGLLLGRQEQERRTIAKLLSLTNAREDQARRNRFLITPEDFIQAELAALKLGLDILGIYHSHPDQPAIPSEFDRQWALPFYSYVIVSIVGGQFAAIASWRLADDRSAFWAEEFVAE